MILCITFLASWWSSSAFTVKARFADCASLKLQATKDPRCVSIGGGAALAILIGIGGQPASADFLIDYGECFI